MSVSLFPKKITVKTMGLTTRQLEGIAVASGDKAVPVLRVWGIVNGKTPGSSNFGPYLTFTGELAAMNLVDEREARSQKAILPQQAETIVSSMLDKAQKDGGAAQVALEITVTENTSQQAKEGRGTKFVYGVKPLIEFKGEDALSAMAKSLPAPVKVRMLSKK